MATRISSPTYLHLVQWIPSPALTAGA